MNRSDKKIGWYLRHLPEVVTNRIKYHSHLIHFHLTSPFLFIHINKTAGSSIEAAFKIPHEHRTASDYLRTFGKQGFEKRFKFAIVRNPWERIVSQYHYRVKTNQTNLGMGQLSFQDWVKLAYLEKDTHYINNSRMFLPQMDWITDRETGRVIVDFVGRFENLSQDFEIICKHLKIEASLPHKKASKHKHYSEYYDEISKHIVGDYFQADIEYFDYEFTSL